MKLSKASLGILGIGFFVIIGSGIGLYSSQQGEEQAKLEKQLVSTNNRIKNLPARTGNGDLVTQQKQIEASQADSGVRLQATMARLRQQVESIETATTLYRVAGESGVAVVSFTTSPPADKKVKNISLSSVLFTATVEGAIPDLVTFVSRFSSQFPTGVVESADITVPTASPQKEVSGVTPTPTPNQKDQPKRPRATVALRIFHYEDR
ncbi:MAG: hypothetical protein HYX87_08060 [Chloroflexi bacterium]|nr:hypothetical protein [Chloroflexota bacterium]